MNTLLAIIGSCLWILIDAKIKAQYNTKLKTLTRTILRYHVCLTLIIYGLVKVFVLQFGEMDLDKLESTIGSRNWMGFLWTYMSYSIYKMVKSIRFEITYVFIFSLRPVCLFIYKKHLLVV